MAKAKSSLNKMKAVREVLDDNGKDTLPLDIQKAIKQKHGVELSTSLISSYKFKLVGGVRKKGRKGARKPEASPASSHPANGRRTGHAGAVTVDEIEAVKKLVDSMGAEKVQQLARVLAK